MGVKLLLLCVICQTVITTTLGGVTLPFSDSIGKVTPIKPKTLPASIVSSSVTTPSPIWDSKDIIPKGSVIKERVLPVPKINSSSLENVKIPESLREKFLSLCKAAISNAKPDIRPPEMSVPYKNPFLSSPTKLPNSSPFNSLSDVYTAPSNKLFSLPSVNSLPNVPVESLKQNDFSSTLFKTNKFLAPPTIKSSSSGDLDSPISLETKIPSIPEKFCSNTSPFSIPCLSPYPLHYKSKYLPGVKTPSECLSFRPFPLKAAANNNFPSQSSSHNLLSPKTSIFDSSLNSLPGRNDASSLLSIHPIKTAEILKPINPIQLPKSASNVPISTKPVSSAQNVAVKNPWPPKEVHTGSASVAFESKLVPPKSALSSNSLRYDQDPLSSLPWSGTSDIKLKPCTPPIINPPAFTPPKISLNSPKTPLVPLSSSSPILDVLSNRISSFDCSTNIDIPYVFPIIGICKETIEKINPYDLGCNHPNCFDSKYLYVAGLEGINLPSLSSDQHQSFTKECVSIPFKYSSPKIPTEPIPTISSEKSSFSPISYSPSSISQTPTIPYQSTTLSIAQATSNMMSSFTTLLSNVVQNILSSYTSSIHSEPRNIMQTPTHTTQLDPYMNTVLIPEEILSILPVLPFPQGKPVNTLSMLPTGSAPIDYLNAPVSESSTIMSNSSCQSSAFEVIPSQPVLISSPQPTATILPPTSLITFSSPQICPSYLPSPILPSYPAISSPFYMEAPVFKKRSSKKDSEMGKMIELMLLNEILNDDESFDRDDLDKLLAFLSLS